MSRTDDLIAFGVQYKRFLFYLVRMDAARGEKRKCDRFGWFLLGAFSRRIVAAGGMGAQSIVCRPKQRWQENTGSNGRHRTSGLVDAVCRDAAGWRLLVTARHIRSSGDRYGVFKAIEPDPFMPGLFQSKLFSGTIFTETMAIGIDDHMKPGGDRVGRCRRSNARPASQMVPAL